MRTVLCLLLLAWASTALAQEVTVVSIVDGDTIRVREGTVTRQIDLAGIDAPDRGQPYAAEAAQALVSLLPDTVFLAQEHPVGGGRRAAEVILPGGMDAGWAMVDQGLAWCRRHFDRQDPLTSFIPKHTIPLCRAENQARRAAVGLWSAPRPVAPWDWRASLSPGEELRRADAEATAHR